MKKTVINAGGITVSVESDDASTGVPDTTQDAGPDTIELHEDAQKPADAAGAEYDAAEHVDTPEDVEKANESTFFGLTLRRRSNEGFGLKTKGTYKSSAEFFKSPEAKAAVETAKAWGTKKKWALATIADTKGATGLKAAGFSFTSAFGAAFAYIEAKGKLNINILFKDPKGAIKQKAFARISVAVKPATKKAAESFLDLTIALRAQEGFALKRTIGAYRNADEFFKGSEFKGTLSTATKWAEGKKYSPIQASEAKSVDVNAVAKFLSKGWSLKSANGNSFLVRETRDTKKITGKLKSHSLDVCILFKTDKNKLVVKLFAKLKLAAGGGVASSESAVMNLILGRESGDAIEGDGNTDEAQVPAQDPASEPAAPAAGAAVTAPAPDDTATAGDPADTAAAVDAGVEGEAGSSTDDPVTPVEVETADVSDVDPDGYEGDDADDLGEGAGDPAAAAASTDDEIADSAVTEAGGDVEPITVETVVTATDPTAAAVAPAADDDDGIADSAVAGEEEPATVDDADPEIKALESILATYDK